MIIKKFLQTYKRLSSIQDRLCRVQEALGRIEMRQMRQSLQGPTANEFRVFSQWGEDGIIQYLIQRIKIEKNIFVEFGVENYLESNTRFLLTNNLWSGLVIDGSEENIGYIKNDSVYWATSLKAVSAFITAENINQLIIDNGVSGDIGVLSIDVDGNDYWIWDSITCISPRIVVCEYNSHFGRLESVTVPYDPKFVRQTAHYSRIYYGASISALADLAEKKGYVLVAGNSAGNNVFFVRRDLVHDLKTISVNEAYRSAQFRESFNQDGELNYYDFQSRIKLIEHMTVLDTRRQQAILIKDLKLI